MFQNCKEFNQPLYKWDVSKVTDMTVMFFRCKKFNQTLNNWDVSKVTDMKGMFRGCEKFDQPLDSWKVDNVTVMTGMFMECKKFNQPLDSWEVNNVTVMTAMFFECKKFNQPLNRWNVSKVIDMNFMFLGCEKFNQPLNNWRINDILKDSINDIHTYMFVSSGMTEDKIKEFCESNQIVYEQAQAQEQEQEQEQEPTQPYNPEPALKNIYEKIPLFDHISQDNTNVDNFFSDYNDDKPFIIYSGKSFSGNSHKWPPSHKMFIECNDDAPNNWQGNSYIKYIKPNGRIIIKMNLNGVIVSVIKPEWFKRNVPGTKIFKLVEQGTITKFMAEEFTKKKIPEDVLGSDHCNQKEKDSQKCYKLEEMSVDELLLELSKNKKSFKSIRRTMSLSSLKKPKSKSKSKSPESRKAKSLGGKNKTIKKTIKKTNKKKT
jgi:surface protein